MDMFEPLDFSEAVDFGAEGSGPFSVNSAFNFNNRNSVVASRPRMYRRSQSASNIMFDANDAFGELLKFHDVDEKELEEADVFEPLPMTSEVDRFSLELRISDFGNMNSELNNTNRNKKRGRRRSLLRRSNSFESAFDKKKAFKFFGTFQHSKRQPSFIRSRNSNSSKGDTISTLSLESSMKSIPDFVSSVDSESSDVVVDNYQGLDIVLLNDCKTLSTKPDIVGNNRLRILLKLESGRFRMLSRAERESTATDLVRMITEDWKGRMLVENRSSYNILSLKDATGALYSLLLGGGNTRNRHSQFVVSSGPTASSYLSGTSVLHKSSSLLTAAPPALHKSSSLLAAAPPLPDFLKKASAEILNSGAKQNPNDMTEKEKQNAAINALKERKKARQLAKQKTQNKD